MRLPRTYNGNESTHDGGGGDYQPLAPGWYQFRITDAEVKQNKAGTGSYLQIVCEVVSEQSNGRLVWEMLTLTNANAEAERIGAEQLEHLAWVADIGALEDTDQLVGQVGWGLTRIEKARGDYPAKTRIGKWSSQPPQPKGGNVQGAHSAMPHPSTQRQERYSAADSGPNDGRGGGYQQHTTTRFKSGDQLPPQTDRGNGPNDADVPF